MTNTISALITWPSSFDYPLFRDNLLALQQHVDEVVVCFTSHGNHDLTDWLIYNLPGCDFTAPLEGKDWRDGAVKSLLLDSSREWVLFLEQDFLIFDYPLFFNTITDALSRDVELVGFLDGDRPHLRFHPAFLLVKKELINDPSFDFSSGEGYDHFGKVSQHLLKRKYITLPELGLIEGADWKHLQGVTENYFAPKPYFKTYEFGKYNSECMGIEPMSEYWLGEMERVDELISRPKI